MLKVKNLDLKLPCSDRITHLSVGKDAADAFGFPKAGRWVRDEDTWILEQSFESEPFVFDPKKCHTCQNWGYPTGCPECGLKAMGG